MELKDININAKELMEFMNSKIVFDIKDARDKEVVMGISYSIKPSEFFDFVISKASRKEDCKIPSTTPEQRSLHPSSY